MVSREGDGRQIQLCLLGGFELWIRGGLVSLPTSSERVLAFLALEGHQASRALVAGTLWPDAPEDKARGSLRSALWRLHLGAKDVVTATASSLRLADGVSVDVHQCQNLARRMIDTSRGPLNGEHDELCRMLSTDLLPGWYEDWVLLEAERWRQVRLRELESLTRRFIDDGRHSEAVLIALAARDAEPLRESACALLIEAHARQGNRSEALREYELYRKLMAEELGLEPTFRLHQVVERLSQPLPVF